MSSSRPTDTDPDWTDVEAEGIPATDDQPPGIGPETAQEGIAPSRDRAMGAIEYGVTGLEERHGDSVAQRAARETPDVDESSLRSDDDSSVGRLVDGDPFDSDPTYASDADGQLIEEWIDDPAGISAEEASMHIIED